MSIEHPFAPFVRILGKGKHGSRSLSQDEAFEAMRMILNQEVEPEQLGAFLMLLRVKEESPEEIAGFVLAARNSFHSPQSLPDVQVDWSSYAGKRRQLPWFLMSALLLASHGIKVFMHAATGIQDQRVYTPASLSVLGILPSQSLDQASQNIQLSHFAYMSLDVLSPRLQRIMDLRSLLGLRSPVHTLSRMLNPMQAPTMMQGIFHPSYRDIHQLAAQLLQQPHLAVLKGEGGEIERNPDSACLVKSVHHGVLSEEEWPALFEQRHLKDDSMDVQRLPQLWNEEIEDEYGLASITGTVALVLHAMGRVHSQADAQDMANEMWRHRPTKWLSV